MLNISRELNNYKVEIVHIASSYYVEYCFNYYSFLYFFFIHLALISDVILGKCIQILQQVKNMAE